VAVKGVVDDNRDFLNEVVTHEQVEDFDTSDTVPFVQVNDDDLDGTIVFQNLDEDDYTIALLSASGYNPVEPVEVSTIKYEIIDDIIEQVAAESEETIKEDPENNRNIAVETPSTSAAATTAATTAASTTEETKQVEVYTVKTVNDEIVYDVSYGSTMELSESELAKYDAVSVYVSSGGSYATQTGYVLSTGSRKIGDDTISYISQILVPVGDVNVSLIDGLQFEMSEVMDTTSTAAPSSSTGSEGTTAKSTTASGTTSTTATSAGSTTATAATTTAGQTTTEATTSATQPTTTQPATTAAAKKTYRVLNLEPVVETGTKSVYSDGWHTINGSKYYYSNGKAYTGWNEIDGIQYYFSSTGVLSSKTVIDVSRYNGNIDWNAVKASGIDYAIIRVGYRGYGSGTLTWDSTFDTNMQGAIAAGIKVGAYIVTQAVNTTEAVEEASFIVNACSKYSISLPLVIDVESAGGGSGRGDQISVSTRTAVINAYAQTVRNAGYTPMVYASKTWLEGRINSGSISSYCKVWIARYNDTLGYSGRYNMWQFRSDGSVSGISGNVDISAWIN
jgi:GH25 family lysozyme M1 (1,4-beta-N-acetylmuramidase)